MMRDGAADEGPLAEAPGGTLLAPAPSGAVGRGAGAEAEGGGTLGPDEPGVGSPFTRVHLPVPSRPLTTSVSGSGAW